MSVGSGSGAHLSKDFFELVKAIGESKSKQEEDRIIATEVSVLKKKMPETGTPRKRMKEYLVRMIYVEMLGHDGSFGYIKAVELCASINLMQKRVGYLAASLCLSPDHDFRFMLVNQLQRDMASNNHLECWAALTALPKIITADMVPAVLNDAVRLLDHKQELVRKKAVMALHRVYQLDSSALGHLTDKIRRALCDRDPAVMAATLCLLHDLAGRSPAAYKDLVPSLVSILKQVVEHRLPREFDYHRMPAPWIQMRLLRLLAVLGHGDQKVSEGMYEMLIDVMKRSDTGINVGYAVMYECVRTVTAVYPNAALLDAAAAAIARFVSSENHNLKYLGITGLAEIVKDHPGYAAAHQVAVIECLEDPDETLRRKTLDLLHRMINPVNVEFIVAKLLVFLEASTDEFLRADLVSRITTSAERFAPSNAWYVRTVTRVFEVAGALVQPDVAANLMVLIAEGSGEDDEADRLLRVESVEHLVDLLMAETDDDAAAGLGADPDEEDKHEPMPPVLVQIVAWVLGEYGALVKDTELASVCPLPALVERLCSIGERPSLDPDSRAHVVSALLKLSAQSAAGGGGGGAAVPRRVAALVESFGRSRDLDLCQRCHEFGALVAAGPGLMRAVLPVDASCEDLEEDGKLAFLDNFVALALSNGAPPYSPPDDGDDEDDAPKGGAAGAGSGLKYDAYAKPEARPGAMASGIAGVGGASGSGGGGLGLGTLPGLDASSVGSGGVKKANALGSSKLGGATGPWGAPQGGPQPDPKAAAVQQPQPNPGQPGANAGGAPAALPSPPPPPAAAAAAPPAGPRELSAKEKEAAMLFGGVGAAPQGGVKTAAARRAARAGATPALGAALGAAEQAVSGGSTAATAMPPATVTPAAPPTASVPAGDLDLLGVFDAPAAPAAAPFQQQQAAAADLFGLSDLSMTPPPAPPASAAAVDPFGAAGLSHTSGGGGGFLFEGSPLSPLPMATPAFGAKWTGMGSGERRVSAPLPPTVRTPEAFGAATSRACGLHVIEIIGKTMEVILAATHGASGTVACVHAKIAVGGTVVVTVRSTNPNLSAAMCEFIPAALTGA